MNTVCWPQEPSLAIEQGQSLWSIFQVSKAYKSPQQIRQFKFWFDQTLNEGMQYESALFQRVCTIDYERRQQVYQQAAQLVHYGADIMITYDDRDCHLWLNLKSKSLLIPVINSSAFS